MKSLISSKNTCFIEYQQKKLNNCDKNTKYIEKKGNLMDYNIFELLE